MERILVVEDEMLVAMLIVDILDDLGFETLGPAMRLETALEYASGADFDFAILDINLAGKHSFPVAEKLKERRIPFIFASGYGRSGLVEPYLDIPVLQKPFDADAIVRLLPGAG